MKRLLYSALVVAAAACTTGSGNLRPTEIEIVPLFDYFDCRATRYRPNLLGRDGYDPESYELDGWHHFLDCRDAQRSERTAITEPLARPEFLFEHAGCHGYRYEDRGWHPFVLCSEGAEGRVPTQKVTQPVEFVFEHEGCSVFRYEYYGWWYFARCDGGSMDIRPSKLTRPVEFLFEHDGCRGYRFEHDGRHNLVHCGLRSGQNTNGVLSKPVEELFELHGCKGYRYEYYGWHPFVRCDGVSSSSVTTDVSRPCTIREEKEEPERPCFREEALQTIIR